MRDVLNRGLENLGLPPVSTEGFARFALYAAMLQEANQKFNLTAVDDTKGIFLRHFADSLSVFAGAEIQAREKIIDVGCGAGFPGLPLKLFALDQKIPVSLTLMDATGKKIAFLQKVCDELGLADVTCVAARAEEAGKSAAFREKYSLSVSRAVARLSVLAELCLPFTAKGGQMAAIKSNSASEEIASAAPAFAALGAEKPRLFPYATEAEGAESLVVLARKTGATPENFPRSFARIRKSPLEEPAG